MKGGKETEKEKYVRIGKLIKALPNLKYEIFSKDDAGVHVVGMRALVYDSIHIQIEIVEFGNLGYLTSISSRSRHKKVFIEAQLQMKMWKERDGDREADRLRERERYKQII